MAQETSELQLNEQYNSLLREILLSGIDLERYSLKYRLAASEQSPLKYLRYGSAQCAGAAGGLALT
ncbi:hypothetical protein BH10CYA1_BH10CYA1_40510 [soil metagenome]